MVMICPPWGDPVSMLELGLDRSKRSGMKKAKHTAEKIIGELWEAEVGLAKGGKGRARNSLSHLWGWAGRPSIYEAISL